MDQAVGVFVVTLEAVEAGAAAPLTILAFVRAAAAGESEATAAAELARDGWSAIRALRSAEVVDEAALPEDFRSALAGARRYGCALIVYDEP